MKFGTVVQEEMSFKDNSYLELCEVPFVQCSGNNYSSFVEGIIKNNSVKLF